MLHTSSWGVRLASLALALVLLGGRGPGAADDGKGPLVPDGDYPKVVEAQLKVLQDSIKAAKEAKDRTILKAMIEKSRCAAVLIAFVAQENLAGKDGPQRASLRDAALQVAALLKAEKFDDAAQKAAELTQAKLDPKAKLDKVKLFDMHIDLTETMSQFRMPKAGGQGIEKLLLSMGADKKKTVPSTSLNDPLLVTLYQTAIAADLSHSYIPPKNAKDWLELCGDMKAGALEMAGHVRNKDGKAAFKALEKLNTSCSVCHQKFREN
jgi:hypothetical protein